MGQQVAGGLVGDSLAAAKRTEAQAEQLELRLRQVEALAAQPERVRRDCDAEFGRAGLDAKGELRRVELRRLLWTFSRRLGSSELTWETIEASAVIGTVEPHIPAVTRDEFFRCALKTVHLVAAELRAKHRELEDTLRENYARQRGDLDVIGAAVGVRGAAASSVTSCGSRSRNSSASSTSSQAAAPTMAFPAKGKGKGKGGTPGGHAVPVPASAAVLPAAGTGTSVVSDGAAFDEVDEPQLLHVFATPLSVPVVAARPPAAESPQFGGAGGCEALLFRPAGVAESPAAALAEAADLPAHEADYGAGLRAWLLDGEGGLDQQDLRIEGGVLVMEEPPAEDDDEEGAGFSLTARFWGSERARRASSYDLSVLEAVLSGEALLRSPLGELLSVIGRGSQAPPLDQVLALVFPDGEALCFVFPEPQACAWFARAALSEAGLPAGGINSGHRHFAS